MASTGERPEPHEEHGYPVIALWVTVLLLIAILAAALSATAADAAGRSAAPWKRRVQARDDEPGASARGHEGAASASTDGAPDASARERGDRGTRTRGVSLLVSLREGLWVRRRGASIAAHEGSFSHSTIGPEALAARVA